MVDAYVFAGPTLPPFQVEEKFGCKLTADGDFCLSSGGCIRFLPPAAEGDIARLVALKPKIIGLIDGYFENVPAVWHKEILYAMSEGIHVLGASSMGALRAAELYAFGMEGVGAVFQAFTDGFLEDDDEVTVVHGPAEQGFPLLSEAMVNIRRTLEDAGAAGIISLTLRDALTSAAKRLHYKSRSYARAMAMAKEEGCDAAALARLQAWLPNGRQDQKLADAVMLMENIMAKLKGPVAPKKVLYQFENTVLWQNARSK